MSNALAVAAATVTLRSLLIGGLGIPDVTIKPPDTARKGLTGNQVNVFLYQTAIDAAWRNRDMPPVKSGETGQPPLPLCLYYLVTAFGEGEDESKAQQLLGRAMSVLHDHPVLDATEIKQATETDVAGSNLHEQIERIRITPQPLSLEEVSKLWAAFQTNYRLSAAYQVSVILLESTRPSRTPLPVLTQGKDDRGPSAQSDLIPPFPTLSRLQLPNNREIARLNDQLILSGHHFTLDKSDPSQVAVSVQLTNTRLPALPAVTIPANQRTDKQITTAIPPQGGMFLAAGLYRITVNVMPNGLPLETRTTNELPVMLAPEITQINGTPLPVPPNAPISAARSNIVNGLGDVTLTVISRPDVLPDQSVMLLIGDRTVTADAHATQTDTLTFSIHQIAAGTFRVRLRVDGVDSPLIDFSDLAHPKFDDSQRVTLT